MCDHPQQTAANVMKGIEPTLISLLTLEGAANTPEAQTAIKEYDLAAVEVAGWTPGTSAQTAVQAVKAADAAFQLLPVPEEFKIFAGLIDAAFTTVVAILEGNTATSVTEQHEITVAAVLHVNEVAPGCFKYHKGIFRAFEASPAKQYHDAWNKKAAELGGKFDALKIA